MDPTLFKELEIEEGQEKGEEEESESGEEE